MEKNFKPKEFVRNPYNYDADKVSDQTGLLCEDESRTEQQHAAEADINYIAERFMRTGQLTVPIHMPEQGDFQDAPDFQTAQNLIVQAKHEFMLMPPKLRSRFQNDPAQLMDFLADPENRDEAIKLGLINKPATITAPSTTEVTHGTETQGSPDAVPQKPKGSGRAQGDARKDAPVEKP